MAGIQPNRLPETFFKKALPFIHLMRLHRPIGTWLCLLPALWGLSLGASTFDPTHIFLFILGAILVRGAGCTINDIWDQDLDARVRRTVDRPLAAGKVRTPHAFLFFGLQLFLASLVLLQFNLRVIQMGLLIIVPIIIYPLMKRYTYWPQIFLGLVFNWGCLMGWFVHKESLSGEIIFLYLGCLCWTIGYDTVYAFQDYEDDLNFGVKSSALKIGYRHAKRFTALCYGAFLLCLLISAFLGPHAFFFLGILGLTPWIGWHIQTINIQAPQACHQFFLWNRNLGLIIWGLILMTKYVW